MTNRQRLLDLNSTLEFKLHRLYFISLLNGGITKQQEALQYARHFQPFASQHQRGEFDDMDDCCTTGIVCFTTTSFDFVGVGATKIGVHRAAMKSIILFINSA